ncbi:hypothetical protein NST74_29310 [Paenibacillus sp. FSL F4-0125]|uniref:hypothetical protein n=1 Tax=Paenibacillus sp. FSL F4-0125 TaxID=2954730 RepID=UPI0030FD1ECC
MSLIRTLFLDEMRLGEYDNVPVKLNRITNKGKFLYCASRIKYAKITGDIINMEGIEEFHARME